LSIANEDFSRAKEDLDKALKATYEKDLYIQENKKVLKQVVLDLKAEKKLRKSKEAALGDSSREYENLRLELDLLKMEKSGQPSPRPGEPIGMDVDMGQIAVEAPVVYPKSQDPDTQEPNAERESKLVSVKSLASSGGQDYSNKQGNDTIIEFSIQIETLKGTIFDLEEKCRGQLDTIENLHSENEDSSTKIRYPLKLLTYIGTLRLNVRTPLMKLKICARTVAEVLG
jgi:sugar-specific transcriptional regulator TrmB